MKKITVNNERFEITAPEERVINTLVKFGPCPLSAFEEGSGRYKRTSLPLNPRRRAQIGIVVINKIEMPDHPFWLDHPRHGSVVEATPLCFEIHKALNS